MKKTDKGELRVRIPRWILDELERTAKESGIEVKPVPSAAAQVLEEWAREQENKRTYELSATEIRERRMRVQAARLSNTELSFTVVNCQKKIDKFRDERADLVPMFELQYHIFAEEMKRRIENKEWFETTYPSAQ